MQGEYQGQTIVDRNNKRQTKNLWKILFFEMPRYLVIVCIK